MLRELNLNEMEMVSGGEDGIISTGTINRGGWVSISREEALALFGDNGLMDLSHGGLGVFGQNGGGSHGGTLDTGTPDSTAEEEPLCTLRQDHAREMNRLDGFNNFADGGAQRSSVAAAAILDDLLGCDE